MKIKNKRITISISMNPEVLNTLNEIIENRSAFIEKCIIEELCKNLEMKDELKKIRIIL